MGTRNPAPVPVDEHIVAVVADILAEVEAHTYHMSIVAEAEEGVHTLHNEVEQYEVEDPKQLLEEVVEEHVSHEVVVDKLNTSVDEAPSEVRVKVRNMEDEEVEGGSTPFGFALVQVGQFEVEFDLEV